MSQPPQPPNTPQTPKASHICTCKIKLGSIYIKGTPRKKARVAICDECGGMKI